MDGNSNVHKSHFNESNVPQTASQLSNLAAPTTQLPVVWCVCAQCTHSTHSAHFTGRNWVILGPIAIFLPAQTILHPPHVTESWVSASLLGYLDFIIPLMAPKASTSLCLRSSFTTGFVTWSATLALLMVISLAFQGPILMVADLLCYRPHQPRCILLHRFRWVVAALWHIRISVVGVSMCMVL